MAGKDWFAKAKVQEPNAASDFEVQLGVGDSTPADFDQGDTVYPNGQGVPFTLTYDGAGNATFTANGVSTTYPVGINDITNIGITVSAPSDATTAVSGLVLSTGSLTTTNVSASNSTQYLNIAGASLNGGFTLTGTLQFDWNTLTSNGENQKMQISLN
ncbi:MAG: choice-of-anchor W domain-containing protein [Candidatus Paceibacterota bacterium]